MSPLTSIRDIFRSTSTPDGKSRHGFFSSEFKNQRKAWAKLTFLTFGLISVFMFAFLSIYFGSYYEQIPRAAHLDIEVILLDNLASPSTSAHPAILGPAVSTAIATALETEPHLGWWESDSATLQQFQIESSGQGISAFEYASNRVLNQDVWGVLIVNANATSGVWAALTAGAEWDPTGAITFVYEEARNFYAGDQYIQRLSTELIVSATSSAASTLAGQILALGNASAVLSAGASAGAVVSPFYYNSHNLRPFDQLAGTASTTVGTVYLIIFTFLISVTWNNQGLPLIQETLTMASEVLIKILVPFMAYWWLALHYSLVSLAFKVSFSRQFGKGGFVLYWIENWITMSALGFVMETFFLWLGPFFPFFLIFWVILNVSVAFLDIADMADFYRYGYILPVWNMVDASKSTIFATKNHLAQNFAVNLGWMAVWMVLLAVTVMYQRRKKEAKRMEEKWQEMKKEDEKRNHHEQ